MAGLGLLLGCPAALPEPPARPPSGADAAVSNPEEGVSWGQVADTLSQPQTSADDDEEGWLDAATAQAEASRILEEVAAARNLPVTRDVEVNVVDRPGIRSFAKRSMYEHTTPEELARLGRVQASMGVIPRGSDIEQIILDLLEQGVAGFYDPTEKTLFIGDFVDKVTLSMVVGHEIAHGLQDMHFDLQKHQEPMLHRNDEETARRFLIEGGAQATYLAWVSGTSGLSAIEDGVLDAMGNQVLDLADFASDYPILVRSLQLPYADGTATVTRLVRQKGWDAVDALYEHLPDSSEQMLHIDKLLAREQPIVTTIDVSVLQALIPGTELLWHDTLGEAELLSMLAQSVRSTEARRAAAGWGGDYYVALDLVPAAESGEADQAADGDRQHVGRWSVPLVVGVIVWDSDRDAAEFEEVFTDYLQRMVPDDHAIDRRGDRVLFATGIPADVEASKLVAAAWKGVRTQEPRRQRRKDRE
ncbi:MAG: hypothetical protein AB1Z98_17595 [Nannocystaceae bacterium]